MLDIMSITILEVHRGRDLSLCLLDGRFVAIRGVEFIMLIIIQEVLPGKDQIQRDYNTSNTGKEKGSMLFNKGIKGSSIRR